MAAFNHPSRIERDQHSSLVEPLEFRVIHPASLKICNINSAGKLESHGETDTAKGRGEGCNGTVWEQEDRVPIKKQGSAEKVESSEGIPSTCR